MRVEDMGLEMEEKKRDGVSASQKRCMRNVCKKKGHSNQVKKIARLIDFIVDGCTAFCK